MLERLKELHYKGLTLTEISRAIFDEYGVQFSRSAIAGKLHRTGLVRLARERVPKEVGQGGTTMTSENTGQNLSKTTLPPPIVVKRTRLPPLSGGLSLELTELTSQACRWPFGEVAPFTFCGMTVKDGASYCPCHSKQATGRWR
jgi:hypothetical protein